MGKLVEKDTVVVVHTPPWGCRDEVMGKFSAGSKGLRRFILKQQPVLLICGHIHERPGLAHIGRTTVVNCAVGHRSRGAMIEYRPGQTPRVEMLM
jgi:Icc-related predicted phosphoesterase